ncbi:hypothetical protein [Kocuria sp. LHG3120]|uniref:hypothetical protein n=1 Tax=Kocuria sp. LHG3120 TaxID=2804590 RepID=UPI003CEA45C0
MTDPPGVTDIANLLVAATALVVALISGTYTWRAFALQRQSTSTAGLDFLHAERHEEIREVLPNEENPTRPLTKVSPRPYYVSVILSRGPGVRYGAQGAVWGKGAFKVLTPQVQVWGPDHSGIEFELKRGAKEEWENVYCGVVWETPRMFKKGFTTDGYRMKLPSPTEPFKSFDAEQWNARKQQWVPIKRDAKTNEPDPLVGAADTGRSFNGQLTDRHPDYDPIEALKNAFRNRNTGNE